MIRALIKIHAETGQYIPVLRYFLEIYTLFDPNKAVVMSKKKQKLEQKKNKNLKVVGSKQLNKKAINLDVMLKVSAEQSTQIEFVQKVFEKFYTLALQYVTSQSASIAFPEMVTIFLHQVCVPLQQLSSFL